jgi:hypothetical protein
MPAAELAGGAARVVAADGATGPAAAVGVAGNPCPGG